MNSEGFLLFLIVKLYISLIALFFRCFFPGRKVISEKDKGLTTLGLGYFLGPKRSLNFPNFNPKISQILPKLYLWQYLATVPLLVPSHRVVSCLFGRHFASTRTLNRTSVYSISGRDEHFFRRKRLERRS